MPNSIMINDLGIVVLTVTGVVTARQLYAGYYESTARFELRGRAALFDWSDADIQTRASEMGELARLPRIYSRIAIVVSTPLMFGLCRAYELASGERRLVRVFLERVEALAWLVEEGSH